ncbi:hypothetical protein AAFF_G00401870 [Aldrovandia affinis]|uniref:Uncharacterized protein n=1 Tax=Aldrovandia affinis TaxID=143900 RepID=A0AAD7R3V2_9TELE|nr:hypothetical protein AAFF_G00401870 [Aldrovandia affinis]
MIRSLESVFLQFLRFIQRKDPSALAPAHTGAVRCIAGERCRNTCVWRRELKMQRTRGTLRSITPLHHQAKPPPVQLP